MKKIILALIFLSLTSCFTSSSRKKTIFFSGTFLKIEKIVKITACKPKNPKHCITRQFGSSASSFVVGHKGNKTYIMTSAHVCATNYGPLAHLPGFEAHETFYGITEEMQKHMYQIESIDHGADLCIVSTKRFKAKRFKIGKQNPERGERIYNIASPIGVFEKNLVPLFEGYYMGQAYNRSVISLPATGGSSGSPILDSTGRVIGVVSAVTRDFHHIVMSSTLEQIKTIIKSVNK